MPELSFKEIKEIKDAYLAKKQGEALERITWPSKHIEGLGLGYYGPMTVLTLGALDLWEDIVNDISTLESKHIHKFTQTIGIASGSRNAKRMEKSLETIGDLGQYFPFSKRDRQPPESVDLNK